MGRGFRLSDEPPLTPLEIYREKRRRARENATLLRMGKIENKEVAIWLADQRMELLGSRTSFVTITFRRVMKGKHVLIQQDLRDKPEQLPLSEIGPHGRRCGSYLPFLNK